jgi:hypothetical protein
MRMSPQASRCRREHFRGLCREILKIDEVTAVAKSPHAARCLRERQLPLKVSTGMLPTTETN